MNFNPTMTKTEERLFVLAVFCATIMVLCAAVYFFMPNTTNKNPEPIPLEDNKQFEMCNVESHNFDKFNGPLRIIKMKNKETGEYLYFVQNGRSINQVYLKSNAHIDKELDFGKKLTGSISLNEDQKAVAPLRPLRPR